MDTFKLTMPDISLITTIVYRPRISVPTLFTQTSFPELSLVLFILVLAVLLADCIHKQRTYGRLPPGPPTSSWIGGNVKQLPKSEPWKTYAIWGSLYGTWTIYLQPFFKLILSNSY